jgi:hypothetical protein
MCADRATTYVKDIVETAFTYADAMTTRMERVVQTLHGTPHSAHFHFHTLLTPMDHLFSPNLLSTCI